MPLTCCTFFEGYRVSHPKIFKQHVTLTPDDDDRGKALFRTRRSILKSLSPEGRTRTFSATIRRPAPSLGQKRDGSNRYTFFATFFLSLSLFSTLSSSSFRFSRARSSSTLEHLKSDKSMTLLHSSSFFPVCSLRVSPSPLVPVTSGPLALTDNHKKPTGN